MIKTNGYNLLLTTDPRNESQCPTPGRCIGNQSRRIQKKKSKEDQQEQGFNFPISQKK